MRRVFKIDSDKSKYYAIQALKAISDYTKPQKMILEPEKKRRSNAQNSLMWVSLLGDFSMQVDFDGKKFLPDIWHDQLKKDFMPDPGTDETLPTYKKWDEMPDGSLKCVASTKLLTKKGMDIYLTKCYAYGCELGIRFTANQKTIYFS
jgi:hypothetical protein